MPSKLLSPPKCPISSIEGPGFRFRPADDEKMWSIPEIKSKFQGCFKADNTEFYEFQPPSGATKILGVHRMDAIVEFPATCFRSPRCRYPPAKEQVSG